MMFKLEAKKNQELFFLGKCAVSSHLHSVFRFIRIESHNNESNTLVYSIYCSYCAFELYYMIGKITPVNVCMKLTNHGNLIV